jgi:hypothetical protein
MKMNEFAKLTGVPAAIDESLEAFEFTVPELEINGIKVKPMNGMGEPLCLTMHPAGGTRFKRSVRKVHMKMTRTDGDKPDDDAAEMTEDEMDAELDTQDGRSSELLARCCSGWNLTDGKAPMKHTLENVSALFVEVPAIRLAVDIEITARGKSSKAKKSA